MVRHPEVAVTGVCDPRLSAFLPPPGEVLPRCADAALQEDFGHPIQLQESAIPRLLCSKVLAAIAVIDTPKRGRVCSQRH